MTLQCWMTKNHSILQHLCASLIRNEPIKSFLAIVQYWMTCWVISLHSVPTASMLMLLITLSDEGPHQMKRQKFMSSTCPVDKGPGRRPKLAVWSQRSRNDSSDIVRINQINQWLCRISESSVVLLTMIPWKEWLIHFILNSSYSDILMSYVLFSLFSNASWGSVSKLNVHFKWDNQRMKVNKVWEMLWSFQECRRLLCKFLGSYWVYLRLCIWYSVLEHPFICQWEKSDKSFISLSALEQVGQRRCQRQKLRNNRPPIKIVSQRVVKSKCYMRPSITTTNECLCIDERAGQRSFLHRGTNSTKGQMISAQFPWLCLAYWDDQGATRLKVNKSEDLWE